MIKVDVGVQGRCREKRLQSDAIQPYRSSVLAPPIRTIHNLGPPVSVHPSIHLVDVRPVVIEERSDVSRRRCRGDGGGGGGGGSVIRRRDETLLDEIPGG